MIMTKEEENTKAAIDNSGSNEESTHIEDPIEAWCAREINRLEEIRRTLDNKFLYHPTKEFLALDLCELLEDYPKVKANIEHYIRNCLECLSMSLYDMALTQRYRKRVIELEQQLKEKEK